MALDFSRLKQRQDKLQQTSERKDFSKIYFKPAIGKQTLRIVPWREDPSYPLIEVQLHKYDTFHKFIPTLANWGEEDPILKFKDKAYKKADITKEEKEFLKNFTPRTGTYVQIIERGKEELGVRLWELNVSNLEAVLAILTEEEYGDVLDIQEGRNLIVTGHTEVNPKTNKSYTAVDIKCSVKQTPLSEDAKLIEKWLKEQQHPLEQYKRYSSDELKQLLSDFLDPKDDDGEAAEEEVLPPKKETPKAPAKAPVAFKKAEPVAPPPVVEPEDEEEETPAPAPKSKAPAAKPVATKAPIKLSPKPAPVEDPEDLPWEGETDELSEVIPNTPPIKVAKAPAAKAPAVSAKARFAGVFEDDEE